MIGNNYTTVGTASSATSGATLAVTTAIAVPGGALLIMSYGAYFAAGGFFAQPVTTDSASSPWSVDGGNNFPQIFAGNTPSCAVGMNLLQVPTSGLPSGTVVTNTWGQALDNRHSVLTYYTGVSGPDPTGLWLAHGNGQECGSPSTALSSLATPNDTLHKHQLLQGCFLANLTSAPTNTSSPSNTWRVSQTIGVTRFVVADAVIANAGGGGILSATLATAVEWCAGYQQYCAGPERMHDQDYTRRPSGLVIPRRAVYRRAS